MGLTASVVPLAWHSLASSALQRTLPHWRTVLASTATLQLPLVWPASVAPPQALVPMTSALWASSATLPKPELATRVPTANAGLRLSPRPPRLHLLHPRPPLPRRSPSLAPRPPTLVH